MTGAQTMLYFREWQRVRDVRKAKGLPHGDVYRHELHLKALGVRKSSKDFTNADLDKVLAVFRAITEPGNLMAQLHALDQPGERAAALREQVRELAMRCVDKPGLEGAYLDGMARRIFGPPQYHLLDERQLAQLAGILQRRIAQLANPRRARPAPGELRHVVRGEVPF